MRTIAVLGLLSILAAPALHAGIYGTVHTSDGRELTGTIRWDRNEIYWDDILDARKTAVPDLPGEDEKEERGFKLNVFGWKMDLDDDGHRTWGFPVPFGNIRSLERDGSRARIVLKNGDTVEAVSSSTDLGPRLRSIVVHDADGSAVELVWRDLVRVELREPPEDRRLDDVRLYGTLHLRDGTSLTGFASFNKNLALTTDSVRARRRTERRDIVLGDVRSLVQTVGNVAEVVPSTGEREQLEIDISVVNLAVPGVGYAAIDGSDCKRFDFAPAPASPRYDAFDGRRIRGTVETGRGETHTGKIVWDMDEAWVFEALDGSSGDVYWSVPFDAIETIEPAGRSATKLGLRNGSELVLSGTNDVNDSNRGIVVVGDDGTTHEIDRDELRKVTLSGP